jgi:phage virion morphogenesis protein
VAGARINVTLDEQAVQARLLRLKALGGPVTLRQIGVGLVANVQARMDAGHDPEGNAWHTLNPAYAAIKRGPGILREAGMRGGLQGSITFRTGAHTVTWGTNKIYGAVHQFGATIVPKSKAALVFKLAGGWVRAKKVTIPARPYLGFGPEDRATVLEALDGQIARALR